MGYELYFDKVATGRTHQVNVGGVIQNQPITGPDGEPESEFVLGAIVDGHAVPLQTFTVGYVEHMAGRPDTAIDSSPSSSPTASGDQPAQPATEQPAAPAEGQPAAQPPAGQPTAEQPAG